MSKCALFLPLLLLAACGGSPAPKTPTPAETEAEPKAEAKTEEPPDTSDKPEPEKADSKKPDSKPASESAKPGRSAQDILTAPDVVFMLSFNDSDVKQAAETKCSASSHNDP